MKVQINKAHYPVTVLGPGKRVGIWFQGCSIGCPGCISRDTWEPDSSKGLEIAELVGWCKSFVSSGLDGITISGGEPFDQPEALEELLDSLSRWRLSAQLDFDILCYSGMSLRRLQAGFRSILYKVDAVITDPFVPTSGAGGLWRGSFNQRIVPITLVGESRYRSAARRQATENPSIQVTVDGEEIWYIGVPRPGDMERLRGALLMRGINQLAVSWRS